MALFQGMGSHACSSHFLWLEDSLTELLFCWKMNSILYPSKYISQFIASFCHWVVHEEILWNILIWTVESSSKRVGISSKESKKDLLLSVRAQCALCLSLPQAPAGYTPVLTRDKELLLGDYLGKILKSNLALMTCHSWETDSFFSRKWWLWGLCCLSLRRTVQEDFCLCLCWFLWRHSESKDQLFPLPPFLSPSFLLLPPSPLSILSKRESVSLVLTRNSEPFVKYLQELVIRSSNSHLNEDRKPLDCVSSCSRALGRTKYKWPHASLVDKT